MLITEAMDELAEAIAPLIDRPVVTDPTRVTNCPCVLIEPPSMNGTSSLLCGQMLWQFRILVIGLPGARIALDQLARLLDSVLTAIDTLSFGVSIVEPVGYVPLTMASQTDPSQAYRITIEGYM